MLTMVSYACERHDRCQRHTTSIFSNQRFHRHIFMRPVFRQVGMRQTHTASTKMSNTPHQLLGIPTHSLHSYTLLGILSHFHAVTCTLVPSAHSHALLDIPKHSQGIPCTSVLSQAPSYTPGHSPTFSCCHLYSYSIPCPLCTGVCLRI